jgi:hypothetical protein
MITMLEMEKSNMEQAHAESREVLKEHMTSAGCGDTGRKECAGKGESDRFGKEVSCTGGSIATSELSLSGSG